MLGAAMVLSLSESVRDSGLLERASDPLSGTILALLRGQRRPEYERKRHLGHRRLGYAWTCPIVLLARLRSGMGAMSARLHASVIPDHRGCSRSRSCGPC
jgi:hypothetical protein